MTTATRSNRPYREATGQDPFWIPTCAHRVASITTWGIVGVDQHPDGSVIVTFSSRRGAPRDEAGHVFEMALEVVEKLANHLW